MTASYIEIHPACAYLHNTQEIPRLDDSSVSILRNTNKVADSRLWRGSILLNNDCSWSFSFYFQHLVDNAAVRKQIAGTKQNVAVKKKQKRCGLT
jgi:hypothetical protein